MDIKDFIKESLLQIVDGITEANTALEAKGAPIPTKWCTMVCSKGWQKRQSCTFYESRL